jgi:hypothetical protein
VGSSARIAAWAALAVFVAGLLFVLLLLMAKGAHAPTIQPAAKLESPASLPGAPIDDGRAASLVESGISPGDIAPPELVATADELQAVYESRKGELPEDLARPIDEDIGMIEGAVAELIAAIAEEPDNESLKRMLVATYRNEVKLLKRALHLTAETGEDEEAAVDE